MDCLFSTFQFFHGGITHQITLYCFRVVLALSKIL